jgi:CheY-specific phosphatase CheX
MAEPTVTIDVIANILALAAQKTLEKSTKKKIKYSSTFIAVPKVCLKPDLGSFVQFSGDYNGLVVMHFTSGAALDLYRNYMLNMGLPENELAKEATSSDVVDTIGELTNQIMGRAMQMVEAKFDLTSYFGQPKSLALSSAITLTPDLDYQDNRRLALSIDTHRFQIELALEKLAFIETSF